MDGIFLKTMVNQLLFWKQSQKKKIFHLKSGKKKCRANANNGVTAYVDEIEGLKPYPAGYLTVSLGGEYLGSCFVQEKPFYTSQNVNVLIPKHDMSEYSKQYIATMIFREGRLHYKAFVDELNRHKIISKEEI